MPRADCATNESAITDARARSSRACSSEMSMQLAQAPLGGEHRQRRLHVDARVAGAHEQRVRLGGRQARVERAVDEQAPDLLERHGADEILDVDAAVAERAALLVGLGDLGREGDDAFEAGLHLGRWSRGRAPGSRMRRVATAYPATSSGPR